MAKQSLLQTLADAQILKHGVDRYPSMERQTLKLVSEVGELSDAILKWRTGSSVKTSAELREDVVAELCDVALSLGALANKLDVNLDKAVSSLVALDERRFNT